VQLRGGVWTTTVSSHQINAIIRYFDVARLTLHRFAVQYEPQGPLRFISAQPRAGAPARGLGHITLLWDSSQHNQVGISVCGNGNGLPCPALGYFRHAGKRFSGTDTGLAVTARGDIVGPVGGYGWILELKGGAPRNLRIQNVEVLPETPLLITIANLSGRRSQLLHTPPTGAGREVRSTNALRCFLKLVHSSKYARDQATNTLSTPVVP
jgi:hypothetical protein